jgi:nucleotide-binding universal stress UspA family protein
MFQRLLLAVDGSQGSLKAAATAAEIARRFGSRVTLVHVMHMPDAVRAATSIAGVAGPEWASGVWDKQAKEIVQEARKAVGLPDDQVKEEILVGHPAEMICRAAEEGSYDLIIMGSRGLSEVSAFFLGSVSDKVSHHAHCPVLLVR